MAKLNTPAPGPLFLTSREVRDMLRLGKSAFADFRKRNPSFPQPVRWIGGQYRFPKDEVLAWLDAACGGRDAAE
ncbi:hypothetical protein AMST5_00985 [freshwater sediment metagenome]|uniref:Helix-turn-helix domain-containing protein n=1 Tax=freshwater sediment metagenome TaxID=556182 RepID=A0AA48LXU0_9ZZZZ